MHQKLDWTCDKDTHSSVVRNSMHLLTFLSFTGAHSSSRGIISPEASGESDLSFIGRKHSTYLLDIVWRGLQFS